MQNTLSVGKISEGFVLDHIEAGKSMEIYKYLHLDKLDCCVAIIKNAKSSKMGRKDIMKIECPIDFIDLDILGFIDHNITINIIQNEEIVEKKLLKLPKEIKNLVNLERIDIIWDGYAKGLPNEILNFEKLKFIEIKKTGFIYKSFGR